MSERFPEKKPGDRLEAVHVNDLNEAAKSFLGISVGGHISKHGKNSFSGAPAWHQYAFEITGFQSGGTSENGLYLGKVRYWDANTSEWKTHDDEYMLDVSDAGSSPGVGDKIVCYWNRQRGMFVPCGAVGLTPFELYDDITPGGTEVEAWLLDPSTLERDETLDKVEVADGILGDVRALGTVTKAGGTPSTGARGWFIPIGGVNQIVAIQRKAKMIVVANTASGHAAVAAGTTTFTATLTRVCDDGQNPLVGAATSLTVTNPGMEIDDNAADITCVQDGSGYRIVDAPCPA